MSEDANGSVRVTLKDVYEAVQNIATDVQELKSQVQSVPDHEARIRTLEAWKNAIPPTMILAVVSIVVAIIESVRR